MEEKDKAGIRSEKISKKQHNFAIGFRIAIDLSHFIPLGEEGIVCVSTLFTEMEPWPNLFTHIESVTS